MTDSIQQKEFTRGNVRDRSRCWPRDPSGLRPRRVLLLSARATTRRSRKPIKWPTASSRARSAALDGGIPILSEESLPAEHATRRSWSRYWLVDPLDGTKEFVKRNGEFTVNIALIEGTRPGPRRRPCPGHRRHVLRRPRGVRWTVAGTEVTRRRRIVDRNTEGPLRVVASRSHGHEALAKLCKTMRSSEDLRSARR